MNWCREEIMNKDDLILEHLDLPGRVVSAYINRRMFKVNRQVIDELTAGGKLGLVQAAFRYDSERNVKFRTYAEVCVRGAVMDAARMLDRVGKHHRARIKAGLANEVDWIHFSKIVLRTLAGAPELSPLHALYRTELRETVTQAIDALPGKERLVVSLYYYDELTLKEIGKVLGTNESRACQLHRQALWRLAKALRCGGAAGEEAYEAKATSKNKKEKSNG